MPRESILGSPVDVEALPRQRPQAKVGQYRGMVCADYAALLDEEGVEYAHMEGLARVHLHVADMLRVMKHHQEELEAIDAVARMGNDIEAVRMFIELREKVAREG